MLYRQDGYGCNRVTELLTLSTFVLKDSWSVLQFLDYDNVLFHLAMLAFVAHRQETQIVYCSKCPSLAIRVRSHADHYSHYGVPSPEAMRLTHTVCTWFTSPECMAMTCSDKRSSRL